MEIAPGWRLMAGGILPDADPLDCCIWACDTGAGTILFDSGAGRDPARLAAMVKHTSPVLCCLLTHGHADHSAGAAGLADLGIDILAGESTRAMVEAGNERAMSLDVAREAGVYPADFRYRPTRISRVVQEGQPLRFGESLIEPVATPGHSHDHLAYLVTRGQQRVLVAGDCLFEGGKVVLQDIWDCSVSDTCRTIRKLGQLDFDIMLPGHRRPVLADAKAHVALARARVDRLLPPELML